MLARGGAQRVRAAGRQQRVQLRLGDQALLLVGLPRAHDLRVVVVVLVVERAAGQGLVEVVLQGPGEGPGAGQEALLEQQGGDVEAAPALGAPGAAQQFVQVGVDLLLLRGGLVQERLDLARTEVLACDLRLQAPHRHLRERPLVDGGPAGKAAGVDHLQQSGEGLGVAVVGRGGQEQAVLALVRQAPQGAGALGVHGVAPPAPGGRGRRRGHVVGLVDHEHIEGVAAGCSRPLGVGQDLAQEALGAHARQPGHGDDDARVQPQRVGGQAVGAPVGGHARGVHDDELQAELLAHLVAPLQGQAGRAHDDDRAGPVAQEELLDDQARLDGLAQADVVGQQQVGARGRERPAQGLELVGLQGGARAEGRLEGPGVGGGDGAPAHGVDEGAQGVRVVEGLGGDGVGQAPVRDHGVADLELPHHAQLLAHAVLVEGLEGDDVLEAGLAVIGGAAEQALGLDLGDGPDGAPDLDDLARFGQGGHGPPGSRGACGRGRGLRRHGACRGWSDRS